MVRPAKPESTMHKADSLYPLTFSGRTFPSQELTLIQGLCRDFGSLGRTEMSKTVCELLQWKRPNGSLKNHECRLLLERMELMGLLRLPAIRKTGHRGSRRVLLTPHSEP